MRVSTIIMLCLTVGCGIKTHKETVKTGPKVEVPETRASIKIAGFYELPNGGFIELTALNDGRVRIESQQILTLNKDKGLAYHPLFSAGPFVLAASGSLLYAQNLTYSNTTNDIEKDGSTSDVTGVKRTEIVVHKNELGNLLITIVIKNGTSIVSPILVNRTLESL